MVKSCNINPQTTNLNGEQITSPLYLELNEILSAKRDVSQGYLKHLIAAKKGTDEIMSAHNMALNIYADLVSPEATAAIKERIESGEIKDPYYPGTETIKLCYYLQSSDVMDSFDEYDSKIKLIIDADTGVTCQAKDRHLKLSRDLVREYFQLKYEHTGIFDLNQILAFNSEYNGVFRAYVDYYDKETQSFHVNIVDYESGISNIDELEHRMDFAASIMEQLKPKLEKLFGQEKVEDVINKVFASALFVLDDNSKTKKRRMTSIDECQSMIGQMIDDSRSMSLSDDETHYVDSEGNQSLRMTSTIPDVVDKPFGSKSDLDKWKAPSTAIGNNVDAFIRDYIAGRFNDRTDDELEEMYNEFGCATSTQWSKLKEDLDKLREQLEKDGLHIYSPESITRANQPIIANGIVKVEKNGRLYDVPVSGTIDLIAYDNKGVFHIIDIKTHRASTDVALSYNKQKWSFQTSGYKKFLSDKYGVEFGESYILPVQVTYPEPQNKDTYRSEHKANQQDELYRTLEDGTELTYEDANPHLDIDKQRDVKDVLKRMTDVQLVSSYDSLSDDTKALFDKIATESEEQENVKGSRSTYFDNGVLSLLDLLMNATSGKAVEPIGHTSTIKKARLHNLDENVPSLSKPNYTMAYIIWNSTIPEGLKENLRLKIRNQIKDFFDGKSKRNPLKYAQNIDAENKSRDEILNDNEIIDSIALVYLAGEIANPKKNENKYEKAIINSFEKKMNEANSALGISPTELANIISNANKNNKVNISKIIDNYPSLRETSISSLGSLSISQKLKNINDTLAKFLSIAKHQKMDVGVENVSLNELLGQAFYLESVIKRDNVSTTNKVLQVISSVIEDCKEVEKLETTIETIDDEENPLNGLTNNVLCGMISNALHTIQYLNKKCDEVSGLLSMIEKSDLGIPIDQISEAKKAISSISGTVNTLRSKLNAKSKTILINELKSQFPNPTITDADGTRMTIEDLVNSEFKDVTMMERMLTAVEECSNPLLGMIGQLKERMRQEGQNETERLKQSINESAATHKIKDGSFMMEVNEKGELTGKYIKDYDEDAYEEAISKITDQLKIKHGRNWFAINAELDARIKSEGLMEKRDDLDGGYYPNRKFFPNQKFNALTEDQKAYWHDFMREKSQIKMNAGVVDDVFNCICIRKSRIDTIKGDLKNLRHGKFTFNYIRKRWKELTKFTSNDAGEYYQSVTQDFEGNVLYSLPKYYSTLLEGETLNEMSTDTTTCLVRYAEVMNNYIAMQSIVNVLEAARTIIENAKYVDRNIVTRPFRSKRFGFADKNYEMPKQDVGTIKMFDTWMKMQVYGMKTKNYKKKYINLSSGFISLVNFGTLAFNVLSAMSNIIQGLNQIIPTMIGGYFFNTKDIAKASWLYDSQFLCPGRHCGWFDIGSNVRKNKVNAFSLRFNIMHNFNEFAKQDYNKNRFEKLINGNIMYMFLHAGEHYLQHTGAFAVMYNKKNMLYDANGKRISAFDAYDTKQTKGGCVLTMKRGMSVEIDGQQYHIITREEMAERFANSEYAKYMRERANVQSQLDNAYVQAGNLEKQIEEIKANNNGKDTDVSQDLSKQLHELLQKIDIAENEIEQFDKFIESFSKKTSKNLAENEISEDDWISMLSQKMSAANHYLHGIYNDEDRNAAQYYMIGRLAMTYRKYLMPNINRRFAAKTYIAALDVEAEGYYVSLHKFHMNMIQSIYGLNHYKDYHKLTKSTKNIVNDYFDSIGVDVADRAKAWKDLSNDERLSIMYGEEVDYSNKSIFNKAAWILSHTLKTAASDSVYGFNDFQKANIRTAYAECLNFILLVIANFILDCDDDDDDTRFMALLKYLTRRAQTEVGALCPLSLALLPFFYFDKKEHEELHNISYGNMFSEIVSLFNQPIPGMNRFMNFSEVFGLLNKNNWEHGSAKYDKKTFDMEAKRILYKQLTPYRQWGFWEVDALHNKTKYYKSGSMWK